MALLSGTGSAGRKSQKCLGSTGTHRPPQNKSEPATGRRCWPETFVCLFMKSSACVITHLSLLMVDGQHTAGLGPCQVLCRLAHGIARSSCCMVISAACGTRTLGSKLMLATIVTLHTRDPACAARPSMCSFTNLAVLKAVQVLPSSTSQNLSPSALKRVRPRLGTTEPQNRNAASSPPARGDLHKAAALCNPCSATCATRE